MGAADPFQLFGIMVEVIRGGWLDERSDMAFTPDQCHNVEDKIHVQIRSVLNVQEMAALALLVDRDALTVAQEAGDVLRAQAVYMDAFYTDVRSALSAWREERGPCPATRWGRMPTPATSSGSRTRVSAATSSPWN